MDDDVEAVARSEHVSAKGAVRVRLVAGLLQALETQGELAPAVDEGKLGPGRVGRDRRPLDDLVRIALDEQVILEGRRLALVAVDDHIAGLTVAQHRPLAPCWEPRATAPEQARLVDLGSDV